MRRFVPLAVTLSLFVAACGGSDDTADSSDPAVPADTAAPATEPAATEPPDTEPANTEPSATEPPATDPPATEPPATEPPATAVVEPPPPALAAFDPLPAGLYDVGVQTIVIDDPSRERPLTTDVWFPLAAGTTGEPHRYTFVTGDYYESPDAITADPSAISPDGPFPLVAWSHGSGGIRYQTSFLTEFLASHGYVVAAPDHTGNTAVDRIAGAGDDPDPAAQLAARDGIALDRVLDIGRVIDEMTNPESTATAGFVGSVDPERIAVSGHSFGGFTAYAVVAGYDNGAGSVEPDSSVDAIVALAPAVGDGGDTSLLSDERLAAVTAPALVMVGDNDQTTPADPNVTRAFTLGASEPSYRIDLVDAQHQSFSDACDYLAFVPELPEPTPIVVEVIEELAVEGCSPGDMAIERVKDLTRTFVLSFLDSVFRDGTMITDGWTALPEDIVFASR